MTSPRPQSGLIVEIPEADLFAAVHQFRVRLDHIHWFGDDVLWLGPRDPAPSTL